MKKQLGIITGKDFLSPSLKKVSNFFLDIYQFKNEIVNFSTYISASADGCCQVQACLKKLR